MGIPFAEVAGRTVAVASASPSAEISTHHICLPCTRICQHRGMSERRLEKTGRKRGKRTRFLRSTVPASKPSFHLGKHIRRSELSCRRRSRRSGLRWWWHRIELNRLLLLRRRLLKVKSIWNRAAVAERRYCVLIAEWRDGIRIAGLLRL